jgi:protein-S-isoprenylcysteine O-methyltransferase Ste14
MPNLTFLLGALLVVLGGYAYTESATRSPMALIPAVLGVLFAVLAFAAGREALRRHAMHAAAGLALLGVVAGLGPLGMGGTRRFPPLMIYSTTAMSVLCAVFLAFAVRSFVAARRARAAR